MSDEDFEPENNQLERPQEGADEERKFEAAPDHQREENLPYDGPVEDNVVGQEAPRMGALANLYHDY